MEGNNGTDEQIILVDEHDNPVGSMEKLQAHRDGTLHRAFSIFIYNNARKMLIHRRASDKYHSGGLWTNACCSHQRAGETLEDAIHRRLQHEMGFDCELKELFYFTYKTHFPETGLYEHELDHVFLGTHDGTVNPHPSEAEEYRWVDIPWLLEDVARKPENYTYWFRLTVERVSGYIV